MLNTFLPNSWKCCKVTQKMQTLVEFCFVSSGERYCFSESAQNATLVFIRLSNRAMSCGLSQRVSAIGISLLNVCLVLML